ncbi:MAG: DMT family transporter [Anaerolineae bacterium]|nr:DMT family transporter [Thermoflexales bacterium]MDW8407503.1 DMT family transporter [Anaerolineae bacterium]
MVKPSPVAYTRGYSIALFSAAILSTTAIFIRHLTQTYQIPALVLAFWRNVFVVLTVAPSLALAFPRLLRVNRRQGAYLAGYGLVLALFNALWTLSVSQNGAALATVLAYCSAAFTALLGRWLLKEPLGWVKLMAIVLSLAGCAVASEAFHPSAWRSNLLGILTGVLSGLFYALYSLMGRSASQAGLNPWTTLLYAFGFAAGFLLAFNLLSGGTVPGAAERPTDLFWLGNAWAGWATLMVLAAGPTVAGFGLYNVSLSVLPSSVANLILTTELACTTLTAHWLLGEHLNSAQVGGSLLIVLGVVLLRVHEGRTAGQSFPTTHPVADDGV